MARDFGSVLAGIPGLGGYLGGEELDRTRQMSELQQFGMLQNIAQQSQTNQRQGAALMRERQLQGALSQLPQDATQEQVIQAIRPFSKPDDLLRIMQGSADKRFATEQAALSRKDALEARLYDIDKRLEDKQLGRDQAAQLARMQDQTRRELAQMGFSVRREIADANAERANKPPAGYRFKGDGSLEPIPGGPADQKLNAAGTGRETVNSLIATIRDQYDQLLKGGGITDPTAGPIDNLQAGISSSGPGQAMGRLLGTNNQSARNQIAQQRPLLLQAIKNATGMSAKQMDSNAELKLYLSAATDPTLDIRANKAALDKLDELYGLSGAAAPKAAGLPDASAIEEELARRARAKGKK